MNGKVTFITFGIGLLVLALCYIAFQPIMDTLIHDVLPGITSITITSTEELLLRISLPLIVCILIIWLIIKFVKRNGSS